MKKQTTEMNTHVDPKILIDTLLICENKDNKIVLYLKTKQNFSNIRATWNH